MEWRVSAAAAMVAAVVGAAAADAQEQPEMVPMELARTLISQLVPFPGPASEPDITVGGLAESLRDVPLPPEARVIGSLSFSPGLAMAAVAVPGEPGRR
jgi:hypothetical protein